MQYVVPACLPSSAARKTRLVALEVSDRPDRSAALKPDHERELDKLLEFVARSADFNGWLVHGSKDKTRSASCALAVHDYLKARNPLFADPDRLAVFEVKDNPGNENFSEDGAVEVHIFVRNRPPKTRPAPVRQESTRLSHPRVAHLLRDEPKPPREKRPAADLPAKRSASSSGTDD